MRRTAPLIVGAGPAGTAAAITLAAGGARATLLERTAETGDALCGGFLSWRTLERLGRLGIAADALNPRPITRLALFVAGRTADAPLPAPALAVSRHRLDTVMQDAAVRAGAGLERGVAVRALEDGRLRLADGAMLAAPALFLAHGKHDLRGVGRAGPEDDPTLGLRVRLRLPPRLRAMVADAIELHLFAGGYAGLAIQEDGTANLCLAVRRSRVRAAGGAEALLAELGRAHPALAERLAGGTGPVDAVANVPYGWRAIRGDAGRYRLGDQAGVIPSLAGEGMGIAIASGIDAARHFATHGPDDSARWQRRFAARTQRPIAVARLARDLAESRFAPLALPLARLGLTQVVARATRIAD